MFTAFIWRLLCSALQIRLQGIARLINEIAMKMYPFFLIKRTVFPEIIKIFFAMELYKLNAFIFQHKTFLQGTHIDVNLSK